MTTDQLLLRSDVVVVGAGLAGLVAARLADRHGVSVLVVDAAPPGGRGTTDHRGGYLLNRGPHALYLGGPAHGVLTDLGLALAGAPPSPDVHVRRGGEVAPLPATAPRLLTSRLLGFRGKVALARFFRRLARQRPADLAGRSFREWLDAGQLPADVERLVEVLARTATYVDAPELAGADLVVAQLQQAGQHGVRYLDGGWGAMVSALASGVRRHAAPAVRVEGDGDGVVVHLAGGSRVVARAAVVAAGSPEAVASLLDRRPFDVGPPVEASCLDLGTTRPARFGVLLGVDRPLYLSDHGIRARLAPAGSSVVHVARYLAPGEAPEPHALRSELEGHAALAGIEGAAVAEARYLHRMRVCSALATAGLGGLAGRPPADASGIDGVWLAGDWVGPTGHLLDACVASAQVAARAAARAATLARR